MSLKTPATGHVEAVGQEPPPRTSSGARSGALLAAPPSPPRRLNYVFLLAAGRLLGSDDYGALAALLSLLTLVLLPAGAVQLAVSREVSRRVALGDDEGAESFGRGCSASASRDRAAGRDRPSDRAAARAAQRPVDGAGGARNQRPTVAIVSPARGRPAPGLSALHRDRRHLRPPVRPAARAARARGRARLRARGSGARRRRGRCSRRPESRSGCSAGR